MQNNFMGGKINSGTIADKVISKKISLRIKQYKRLRMAKKMKALYFLLLIPIIHLFIFEYIPMYGIIIAFKDFNPSKGIFGSEWNNFEHFIRLFTGFEFNRVFINTLIISILKLVCGFPAPIILAILLNEMRNMILKRTIQTISYLPHFISWVILAGMVSEIFSPQRGVFNYIITLFGGKPIYFLASKDWFRPVLVLTQIWKNAGWGSIIYLATLSSIDIESYDSATIDGANRFQKAVHITIPGLVPVITILFILNLGKILNAGFDQVINLYNPLAYEIADIIDTYVYRIGLIDAKYDFASAVGVFKNVVGVLLIFTSNAVIRKFNEYGIW